MIAHRYSTIALAAALAFASPFAASAQDKAAADETASVDVTGQAAIFNNDKGMAKDRAVEDALRQAVEQVAGTMISSTSLVQNSMLMEDSIYSQAKGYVKSYKITNEREDRGTLEVSIRAEVSKKQMAGDIDRIRASLERVEYPRVMVMISEDNVTAQANSFNTGVTALSTNLGTVENAFIDAWQPKGFTFVDRQALSGKISQSPTLKVLSAQLTPEQVEELANLTDAQIIIYGKSVTNAAGSVMGTQLQSSRANISVRVINADNGEILASDTAQAGAAHIDPTTAGVNALKKATDQLADKLLEKVVQKWASATANVALEVVGVKNMAMLSELKNVLRSEVRGVKGVRERKYDAKLVTIDLVLAGRTSALAAELEAKPFDKITFKVVERTANKLRVEVSSKK